MNKDHTTSINIKSISINDIINELPCKKNPFLAIAYPSSLVIKNRKYYSSNLSTEIIDSEFNG